MLLIRFFLKIVTAKMRQSPYLIVHKRIKYCQIKIQSNLELIRTWQYYISNMATQSVSPVIEGMAQATAVINETVIQSEQSYLFVYIIVIALVAVLFVLWRGKKSQSRKRQIGFVGERGSGKTQLFININGGKTFQTVPSISNNYCNLQLGNKIFKVSDFIGDNLSKEEVINQISRFHTLVHVVDGTDSKKLTDAAIFIYRLLISKNYQKQPCNFVIFLNKQDEKGFYGQQKLVKRIQDEIETVKLSRKNQVEDNEGQEDYLKNQKTRFDFKKQGIEVVVGSARKNRENLVNKLQQLCA